METENLGNRIIAALTGRTQVADSGTGNPAYAQEGYQPNYAPSGEMPGYGAGYQPNYTPPGYGAGYQQNYAPPGGAQGYQPNYAPPGGAQGYQPNYAPPGETPAFGQQIRCDKCGWTPENTDQIPKFCPNCGDRIDWNDAL